MAAQGDGQRISALMPARRFALVVFGGVADESVGRDALLRDARG